MAADKSTTEILLLDEPTSSVDAKNEQKIYANIFQRWPHMAIVSAIHRLHLLPMFDQIVLLDGGHQVCSRVCSCLLFIACLQARLSIC